jgi:MFS family permease
MFGFHKRNRSLIPVKSIDALEISEKRMLLLQEEEIYMEDEDSSELGDEEQPGYRTRQDRRNLVMIYLLFLAEAIMSSSLSTQIMVLVPSATGCVDMDVSFLRSILQCAYFFGSFAGVSWGFVADRWGRRKVALLGLVGMSTCCLCMGFATSLQAFTGLRFMAGVVGSAVTVSGLAMLADATHGSNDRVTAVARLPVIALGGSIGPLAAQVMRCVGESTRVGVFGRFPGLSSQIACASFVLSIGVAEMFLLKEVRTILAMLPNLQLLTTPQTLPQPTSKSTEHEHYNDCEKATFLGQSQLNDSTDSLNISIIEALNDSTASPLPSYLSVSQLLTAPSVLILLASYSVLSLHSSTFEILLPHLAHTGSHQGGLGIPCAWLTSVVTIVKIVAAIRILHFVPSVVNKTGLLPVYRRISAVFPIFYIAVPLLGLAVNAAGGSPMISAVFNTIAMLAKTTLAGAAQVLVLLLVLNAAPDASSTGTVIGVVSISELFKALAVGASGVSFYLSSDYSMVIVNGSLWAALAFIAILGAGVTWRLNESPRVGTDIPEECLVWQDMFDVNSDEEAGF